MFVIKELFFWLKEDKLISLNQDKVLTFCSWPHFKRLAEHLMGNRAAIRKPDPKEENTPEHTQAHAVRSHTRGTLPGLYQTQRINSQKPYVRTLAWADVTHLQHFTQTPTLKIRAETSH